MAVAQQNALEQLRMTLLDSGVDYLLLSPLPASTAQVQFIGRFKGLEVVWDMQLSTLECYEQERGLLQTNLQLRGLLQITPSAAQIYALEVALRVAIIDVPTIRKTIHMLRNYRKLRLGLHTWGDAI